MGQKEKRKKKKNNTIIIKVRFIWTNQVIRNHKHVDEEFFHGTVALRGICVHSGLEYVCTMLVIGKVNASRLYMNNGT